MTILAPRHVFALLVSCTLFLAPRAIASNDAAGTNSDVSRLINQADGDILGRRFQMALAKLETIVHPQGVKLTIDRESDGGPEAELLARALSRAIDAWDAALGGSPVRMALTDEAPDLKVRFVSSIGGATDRMGQIKMTRTFRWNAKDHDSSVGGAIEGVTRIEGRAIKEAEAANILMHEIGHVLGLDDAYASQSGVMGMFDVRQIKRVPSDNEVSAVLKLRSEVASRITRVQTRIASLKSG